MSLFSGGRLCNGETPAGRGHQRANAGNWSSSVLVDRPVGRSAPRWFAAGLQLYLCEDDTEIQHWKLILPLERTALKFDCMLEVIHLACLKIFQSFIVFRATIT